MGDTQTSKVHQADIQNPTDMDMWIDLTDEQYRWLIRNSDGFEYSESDGAGKWYNEKQDITKLSKQFSNILFVSWSLGEDGDRWAIFARDGFVEQVNPSIIIPHPAHLLPKS